MRQVVAKAEWQSGEFNWQVGFIVTDLKRPGERLVKFSAKRGTEDQWIKDGKLALRWTRPSCHVFRSNATRPQLFALAYTLADLL